MDMVDFVWVWWMVGVGGVGDVERRLIMGVERDRSRGSACEGSACPSAEASRSETAPAEWAVNSLSKMIELAM